MSHPFDPERYFQRIGYTGPREATLDVLRAIHSLHPLAIPFENLDPIRGQPVDVELPSVVAKLLDGGRGGYCFEQNALFANALTHLGFVVTPLIGRVVWGRSFDGEAPLTHMLLRVDLDGEAWLADVGFGSVTLTAPLRLHSAQPQSTLLETFRLETVRTEDGGPPSEYRLSVRSADKWLPVYRFAPKPAEWIDYKLGNWYTSSAPDSIFRNQLIVCRVLPLGRISLLNTTLTERSAQGDVVAETDIASAAQLAQVLRERFGLKLDGIDIDALYDQVRACAAKAAG
ncbi:arylamine N-acetyltransferase [Pandoraea sp. XJJ-1]|uniref:arylamine N-acetyltransferase family protein n=1 Tax=unclassified Pandoraea TaxID=2624094 RepID=UPI00034753B4|nr:MULTISPECIES: arylamine N-acetyltransferase [unclassified Pandoraea]OJY18968.1 MAG: N-hydroxyarylamine O-acetyltransferase [Pandoraea sp. 64-18]WAL82278.1 arylamine N-acetyltransferase [Pandoraea sp. XJJ-1]